MKLLFLLFVCISNTYATTIEFIGPCDSKPIFDANVKYDYSNVGELTIGILEKYNIQYEGTELGLNQVFRTPMGLDAQEIISDEEMRSYGWCFKIDGIIPEKYAGEIPMSDKFKVITWYYGHAYYKRGKWLSMCQETHKIKPAFLCAQTKPFNPAD